ncbi:methionine/alanine import family NSS transporter small subunit [uncultured Gulosibacter sp.]|nr:methionine/alanine import family NSS transporter small subunit [uncultured Gulosibacter sp.]
MTAEAIIMMLVAMLTVWGGLVAAIVNLRLRSSDREH